MIGTKLVLRAVCLFILMASAQPLDAAQSDFAKAIEKATPKYVQNIVVVDDESYIRIEGNVDNSKMLAKYMRCLDQKFGSPTLDRMTRKGKLTNFVLRIKVVGHQEDGTPSVCA